MTWWWKTRYFLTWGLISAVCHQYIFCSWCGVIWWSVNCGKTWVSDSILSSMTLEYLTQNIYKWHQPPWWWSQFGTYARLLNLLFDAKQNIMAWTDVAKCQGVFSVHIHVLFCIYFTWWMQLHSLTPSMLMESASWGVSSFITTILSNPTLKTHPLTMLNLHSNHDTIWCVNFESIPKKWMHLYLLIPFHDANLHQNGRFSSLTQAPKCDYHHGGWLCLQMFCARPSGVIEERISDQKWNWLLIHNYQNQIRYISTLGFTLQWCRWAWEGGWPSGNSRIWFVFSAVSTCLCIGLNLYLPHSCWNIYD